MKQESREFGSILLYNKNSHTVAVLVEKTEYCCRAGLTGRAWSLRKMKGN